MKVQASLLRKCMGVNPLTQGRQFSMAAFNVKSKFEKAYEYKVETLNKVNQGKV